MQVSRSEDDTRRAEEARAEGRRAADRALALDPDNSDALAHKALLIDPTDWIGKESLLKRAIAAQPLDCGCEHYNYGLMLQSVGRLADASEQFRHATDMLPFWVPSQFSSADTLLATGQIELARSHFDTILDLNPDASLREWVTLAASIETGDYAAGMTALRDPELRMPEQTRTALLSGFQAIASGDAAAKALAVNTLVALADGQKNPVVVRTIAVLGAPDEALGLYVKGIRLGDLVPEHARRAERPGLPRRDAAPWPHRLLAYDAHQAGRLRHEQPAALLPDDLNPVCSSKRGQSRIRCVREKRRSQLD